MKKISKSVAFLLLGLLLIPTNIFGQWVRPNHFVNQKGSERIAEIKRFQAQNNLPVTGGLNKETQKILYDKNYFAYDAIQKAPSQGYWIVINKSKRILTLYKGQNPVGKYPVCLGTKSTPTPSGKATIQNRHVNPAWGGMGGKYTPIPGNHPRNPLGKRWMGLRIPGKSGYGIHGTIKPHEIGTYSSNGCIRLFNYDVETFVFPKMAVGAPVWMGTDSELAKMGVQQMIGKTSESKKAKQSPQVKEEKPLKAITLY